MQVEQILELKEKMVSNFPFSASKHELFLKSTCEQKMQFYETDWKGQWFLIEVVAFFK